MQLLKALAVSLLVVHGLTWAENFAGRVVGVIDGDTVDLLTDDKTLMRVRLSGIDAPEKKQAFGNAAKKMLSNLIYDRRVVITGHKRDRWGRLIGKVTVAGTDMNLQMIQHGLAWHYKKYEKEQSADDRRSYGEAEVKAKTMRIGLWADKKPVPPWEFRSSRKPSQ